MVTQIFDSVRQLAQSYYWHTKFGLHILLKVMRNDDVS